MRVSCDFLDFQIRASVFSRICCYAFVLDLLSRWCGVELLFACADGGSGEDRVSGEGRVGGAQPGTSDALAPIRTEFGFPSIYHGIAVYVAGNFGAKNGKMNV